MNKVAIISTLKESGMNSAVFYTRTKICLKGEKVGSDSSVINGAECVSSNWAETILDARSVIHLTYWENPHKQDDQKLFLHFSKLFEGTYSFFVEEIDFFYALDFWKFDNVQPNSLYFNSCTLVNTIVEKEIIEETIYEGKIIFSNVALPEEPVDENVLMEEDDDPFDYDDNPLYGIAHYALTIENSEHNAMVAVNHYNYEWNSPIEITMLEDEELSLYKEAKHDVIFSIENGIATHRQCVDYSVLIVSNKETEEIELILFQKDPTHEIFYKDDLTKEVILFSTKSTVLDQLNIQKDQPLFV